MEQVGVTDPLIAFEGVWNLRDFGGRKTQDRRAVRSGLIFRSDELTRMTQAGADQLRDNLSIRCIVDLRGHLELGARNPAVSFWLQVKYVNFPPSWVPAPAAMGDSCKDCGQWQVWGLGWKAFGESLVNILKVVAMEDYLPAVMHHIAGKDRTGLAAAMLLGALGVSDTEIVSDYSLSDWHMPVIVGRLASDITMMRRNRTLTSY